MDEVVLEGEEADQPVVLDHRAASRNVASASTLATSRCIISATRKIPSSGLLCCTFYSSRAGRPTWAPSGRM